MVEREIRRGEPYEMEPEDDATVADMIEQADRDIEEMRASGRWGASEDSFPVKQRAPQAQIPEEAKVTMRWRREQLDVVRKAADLFGMPSRTYVKQAAFRAALDDLQKLEAAGGGSNDEAA
jgi:predicted DNA binding CopG/RHH family protein